MKLKLWYLLLFLIPLKVFAAYMPNPTISWTSITGKPTFHTIATSGDYEDLTNKPAIDSSLRIRGYDSSGLITQNLKLWMEDITPATATGQTIDISNAGFTEVICVNITAQYTDRPIWCIVTAKTPTQVTFNSYQPSTNIISLLGQSVLSGSPVVPAIDLENIALHVVVMGI